MMLEIKDSFAGFIAGTLIYLLWLKGHGLI